MRKWLLLLATSVAAGFSVAKAGQFDLPKPEVYLRVEDQQRARLLLKQIARLPPTPALVSKERGYKQRFADSIVPSTVETSSPGARALF